MKNVPDSGILLLKLDGGYRVEFTLLKFIKLYMHSFSIFLCMHFDFQMFIFKKEPSMCCEHIHQKFCSMCMHAKGFNEETQHPCYVTSSLLV